jgi:hypothetical protein
MANILVQLTTVQATLPATNAPFQQTVVTSTDGAGGVQTANLTGVETPPWSVIFKNVAAGTGNVVATPTDTAGTAIGTPVTQAYTVTGGTTGGTFPSVSGITVTQQ